MTNAGAASLNDGDAMQAGTPLPHVAVQCLPGCLALRWLQDARGATRLTILVRPARSNGWQGARLPTDDTDVAGCISFAAAVSGIARADALVLGRTPRVIRIPVGTDSPPFLAVEIPANGERGFNIVVAEPWFRSPSDTLAMLDAFVRSVAGEPDRASVERPISTEITLECADAPADVAVAFATIQRRAPAIVHGMLPAAYRQALAGAVAAARMETGPGGVAA